MSAGRDNALKHWVFDATDGAARLLRFRSGHAAPPTVVRHYSTGKLLLSAGGQSCRRARVLPGLLLLLEARQAYLHQGFLKL